MAINRNTAILVFIILSSTSKISHQRKRITGDLRPIT
jgi:hypothetical protein